MNSGAEPLSSVDLGAKLEALRKQCEGVCADASLVMELAELCEECGMRDEALAHYQRRSGMSPEGDPVWLSLYRIACILHGRPGAVVEDVIHAFSKVYAMDSSRSEPLVHLCSIYRRSQNFEMAYSLAQLAFEIPRSLKVSHSEQELFDIRLPAEFALAADALGKVAKALPMLRYLQLHQGHPYLPEEVTRLLKRLPNLEEHFLAEGDSQEHFAWPLLNFVKPAWWEKP